MAYKSKFELNFTQIARESLALKKMFFQLNLHSFIGDKSVH